MFGRTKQRENLAAREDERRAAAAVRETRRAAYERYLVPADGWAQVIDEVTNRKRKSDDLDKAPELRNTTYAAATALDLVAPADTVRLVQDHLTALDDYHRLVVTGGASVRVANERMDAVRKARETLVNACRAELDVEPLRQ